MVCQGITEPAGGFSREVHLTQPPAGYEIRLDDENLPRVTGNGFKELTLLLEMIGLTEYQKTRGRFSDWSARVLRNPLEVSRGRYISPNLPRVASIRLDDENLPRVANIRIK